MADVEKKRGALLTLWLALMLIANAGTAVYYLLFGSTVASSLSAIGISSVPSWTIYALGVVAIVNVVLTIFLFMWKKWAFYGYAAITVAVFVINIIIGLGYSSLIGLIGIIILYLILRSKWSYLE